MKGEVRDGVETVTCTFIIMGKHFMHYSIYILIHSLELQFHSLE